ncbi:hypothetical protein DYB36_001723 [Aphanomyces astaci]|uniref:Uncharacterized protein n=1 Tax=Aphanomyces astaci TaxID=112090 RepID=A0A397B2X9_APHAT|nr:hypothetical protein DYB36_001723 [Aphanomyces astaci]
MQQQVLSWSALIGTLYKLEGQNYGAYNSLRGQEYRHAEHPAFILAADSIQGDAFAAPSRFHVVLDASSARYPTDMLSTKSRRISVADFLARQFVRATRARGADARVGGQGWHGAKGGDLSMDSPSQYVLERTNVLVLADGSVEARFTVGLPARGRSICGDFATRILTDVVPALILEALVCPADVADLWGHVKCVEDQSALRQLVADQGLVAFSGASDTPMASPPAQPFQAPRSSPLHRTFTLPHHGPISGLGIPRGITLLVGGGYHGKSTVLQAVEGGVYDTVPGDGREFVVADPRAVKIRAEDGRSVVGCNVSPFISNLPSKVTTEAFTSANASGSTSQAANIMEAIEAGATTLLMDEDTCATNFMTRDGYNIPTNIIAVDDDVICRVYDLQARALFTVHGMSSILVDVTTQAKAIASQHPPIAQSSTFLASTVRVLDPAGIPVVDARRVKCLGTNTINYGDLEGAIDVSAVGHLVEPGQLRAIAHVLRGNLANDMNGRRSISVREMLLYEAT